MIQFSIFLLFYFTKIVKAWKNNNKNNNNNYYYFGRVGTMKRGWCLNKKYLYIFIRNCWLYCLNGSNKVGQVRVSYTITRTMLHTHICAGRRSWTVEERKAVADVLYNGPSHSYIYFFSLLCTYIDVHARAQRRVRSNTKINWPDDGGLKNNTITMCCAVCVCVCANSH
jgi:hypothetical protein